DLAQWLPNGHLHYLGRTDDQIKLRGFRIEPGEIATVLTSYASAAQAAVLVREDAPGMQQLVAYVVPAPGTDIDPDALRTLAADRLPEYMVPTAFVALPALPLSPNGKLDRRALPAPELAAVSSSRAPRDVREEVLTGILASVLGRPTVGVRDDFFALGGHSLLAARAAGRIREVLGVECGIRDVFELRTVEALAARLAPAGASSRPRPGAGVRPERPPLSFAQHRLWVVDSVRGPAATYNVPVAVRLRGPVDFPALRAAVGDLVARHEVLRTVIADHDGEPYQRVLPVGVDVPVELRDVPVDRLADEAVRAGGHLFDLASEIPVRVTLLRAAPDDHVLLLLVHHVATDESSTALLLADLDAAYTARRAGTAPVLPELPFQYVDFAQWQREVLGDAADPGSTAARQTEFWRETLAGVPAEVALPTDRSRPAEPSYEGGVVGFSVSAATTEGLLRIAREGGATPFMVVHAAVAALLHRLGAGDDIPLGSPVSGRDGAAWEGLAGFFLNTLVLRADLSGAPTFGELVARVRDTGLAAFAHADLPWEAVVEAVDHERSRSRNPLFQTMVTYHSVDAVDAVVPELFGMPAAELTVETGGAKFDLEIAFGTAREGAGIEGGIRYASDLFDEATVRTLAARLVRLLDAAVAAPDRPVAELEVMSAEERALVLDGWNDTAVPMTGPTTLADLVAEGACAADGPALVFEGAQLARPAFEERVNRLARLLIDRGVGPETVVAVALPRSLSLLVALHAVVRAGGAYLPLDLSLPTERLGCMTDTATPVCVVTDLVSLGLVPMPAGAEVVVVDAPEIGVELGRLSAGPLSDGDRLSPLLPRHPAYVIFTSGSTGRPKGVMVEHEAIVNRLRWMQHTYQLTTTDRVL
ncbi:condensation domain-containing protein, partial [Streptomyces sp. NPDC001568]|uniref:condensation domain-containing protein n=1 Tax=Streptomyces sp. NPDC001568 TaxID=3364588 RepID=UPI00367E8ED6